MSWIPAEPEAYAFYLFISHSLKSKRVVGAIAKKNDEFYFLVPRFIQRIAKPYLLSSVFIRKADKKEMRVQVGTRIVKATCWKIHATTLKELDIFIEETRVILENLLGTKITVSKRYKTGKKMLPYVVEVRKEDVDKLARKLIETLKLR